MKTDELREKYLEFFESRGHHRCPSDVLVPTWDPSVLFTPAGMNQFKDHFLGRVKLDFARATSCQKCLRTGDIENVGRTAYHHTFFEMLGNFSFGDYFKQDAIQWAWEFCTAAKWLGLDPDRLTVTVYVDDDEAATIWQDHVGLPSSRIERMGEDDNFWPAGAPSQGPDGVCGPCSEIFYRDDFGAAVEIWNLVFTQFNRVGRPPDNLRPLPSRNIDTGMGLERTAAALQGVQTNFHIDILRPIVEAAAEICGVEYEPESDTGRRLRRITDHVRAGTFAIHENVYPGAQKEKYVIRRLLRRAVLEGHQLGMRDPFLYQLVPVVVAMMRAPYPELADTSARVQQVIQQEEETFLATLDAGLARIERVFADMRGESRVVVDGHEVAELYSTYGIPPDLVESMAAEQNLTFDAEGFRQAMIEHGIASGKAQFDVFKTGPVEALKKALHETEFVGYETSQCEAEVKGIIAEEQLCDELRGDTGDRPATIVLDRTPFYAESGGQVGDTGVLENPDCKFLVLDTQRDGNLMLHQGKLVSGQLKAGDRITAKVDAPRRDAIRRAHSGTHLLHYALQKNLGKHAQQQGSKVDADWFRFDFTNMKSVGERQLVQIEQDVRKQITTAADVHCDYVPLAAARKEGAMMLFGEKYPDPVRLVTMGDFSKELCGGTHVENTRQVDAFEIIGEEAVSAGTRRITALTGSRAAEYAERVRTAWSQAASTLGVGATQIPEAVRDLLQETRDLRKQLTSGAHKRARTTPAAATDEKAAEVDYIALRAALRHAARLLNVGPFDVPERIQSLLHERAQLRRQAERLAQSEQISAESLVKEAVTVGSARVIAREIHDANTNLLRQLIDQIRKTHPDVATLLANCPTQQKVVLVAGLSKNLVQQGLDASQWVKQVAVLVGGGGGGRADMAQAGGRHPDKLSAALQKAPSILAQMLQQNTP